MDKKIIEQIEKILLTEKEELKKQLESFADKNKHAENDYDAKFPDYGNHEDENAAEVADFEGGLYLEKTLEKSLQKTIEALESIKKGTYGKCIQCGKSIPEKRCLAFPTANKCMDCKKSTL
ncbi:TraR/DksA C4-type zinc finger protein [bacterium]|nr:TraR/DksA C4-type zinc finger protein [bacterium]